MRLTRQTNYAMRILMYCAANDGRLSRIPEIASAYSVSELFLFKILQPLVEAGLVETVRGRRLYLPDIRSRNRQLQQYAERAAINAPMQGTAADIIKLAMLRVQHECRARALPAKLIMQVHDELVLEVKADAVQIVSTMLREQMTAAEKLAVPLKVEIGTGSNWDEAH